MKQLYLKTIVLLLVCMVGSSAMAYDCVVDGIYYDLDQEEMTAKVTNPNSVSHNSYSGDIVIPSTITYSEQVYGVTSIGKSAFSGCTGLTTIIIPNSVTSIKDGAFRGCSSLNSVTISNSVTSIGEYVFSNCSGLTSITIPNSVTKVGKSVFAGCNGLISITVESGNTTYDSRNNCNAIIETATNTLIAGCKNTVIPNSVTSIGNGAFWECTGLTTIIIPNSVTSILSSAFYGCTDLTSITIPSSVTSIGNGAFSWCTGLISVTISNSVTSIEAYAFVGCTGLTSVTIPSSVTSIGQEAFSRCSGLTSVICHAITPPTCGSIVFYEVDKQTCKLFVPTGSKAAYQNADEWKDFSLIEEGAETMSVTTTKAEDRSTRSIYSIDGKQLSSPLKGLNIICMSDGTIRKVMVK